MAALRCRHCGAALGPRAQYVKRGDVLQLWHGQWALDPDGVWRRKRRIRRKVRFIARGLADGWTLPGFAGDGPLHVGGRLCLHDDGPRGDRDGARLLETPSRRKAHGPWIVPTRYPPCLLYTSPSPRD